MKVSAVLLNPKLAGRLMPGLNSIQDKSSESAKVPILRLIHLLS